MPEDGFFHLPPQDENEFRRDRTFIAGPALDPDVPSTPRTSTSLMPSAMLPLPFHRTESGAFAKAGQHLSMVSPSVVPVTLSDPR